MIDDFLYIWQLREKPVSFKRRIKVFLKRLYHAKGLFQLLLRTSILKYKGCRLGRLVVLGRSTITGNKSNLSIGDETGFGRCVLALHDKVIIGKRVVINDGVQILTASHDVNSSSWESKSSPIVIDDYAWIATNAIILPGSHVGRGVVVGAGAVVKGTIPDYSIVSGNPYHLHKSKRNRDLDYSPVLSKPELEAWVGHK